ncbi:MAG: hypothetical protein Q7U14_00070, partial [Lacisediminimonas sp.]|nr:hypothetical protein [Lacisediminimonas sp.]
FFFPRIRIIVSLSLFDYADSAEQKLFDQMVQKVQSLMKEEPNFLTALGELCNTTNKEIEVLMLHGSEKKAQDLGRFLALFVSVKGIAEAIGDGARLDKQKGRFARAVGGLEELCYPKSTTEPNLAIHSPTTTTATASTTTTTTMSYGPGPHSDAGGRKEKKSREKGNKNDPSSSVEQVGDDKKAKRAGTDKAGKSSKPGGKIKRLSMKFLMPKEAQVLPTAAQLREVDGILIGYGDTWSESSRERERLGLNKNFPAPQEPHESWGDD